jgi:ectoine hydroxylase-related dioxygenase (phytanoyl-CoA dioxygenase family)
MNALSTSQKLFYETNGYLVIPDALSGTELANVQQAFEKALDRWKSDETRPGNRKPNEQQIINIIEYDDQLLRLMTHSSTFPLVREIIGDDIAMIDNDGHVKPANSVTHISWHHDVAVRGVHHPLSTLMVKVFFLLTDTSPEGGATAFLPGTHHYPMDYEFPKAEDPETMPGHVRMAFKAGTAYLFNGRVYHAALNNYSQLDRKAIIINYGHFWMKPWSGYEPGEELRKRANTPELRQLLHIGDAYGQSLTTG